MRGINIENMISIDDTGMPKAPSVRQIVDKDVLELWSRDKTSDKRKYIQEAGVIYYLGDPNSPAKQQGLNDEEELRSLCIEMGWKIDWYESYKANFPEFSI